jgi:hypothetical protein
MASIVENKELSSHIRVALVIEAGKIKPVGFEESDKLSPHLNKIPKIQKPSNGVLIFQRKV